MKNKVIIPELLSIFLLILICCEQEPDWLKALKKVDQTSLYSNNYKGWNLIQEFKDESSTEFTIEKIDSDTLKVLFYFHNKIKDSVHVNYYRKEYNCSQSERCFIEMQYGDTLYFYRELANGEKKFIVGEYQYRFEKVIMEPDEVNYFSIFEDSLRKVRGNNLPKLPVISDTEKKRLESLLNK